MAFASCTTCQRRHKRPINSKCEYMKAATEKCKELGLPSTDYVYYLPELFEEDIDPAEIMARKGTKEPVIGTEPVGQTVVVSVTAATSPIMTPWIPAASALGAPWTSIQEIQGSPSVGPPPGFVAPPQGMAAIGASLTGPTRPGLGSTTTPPGHAAPLQPYLPPYLLPGAAQQATVQIPYRCELDHQHPPKQSCTTAKRKLTIYDLDVHMRYTSSANVTIDDTIAGSLSLLESMLRQGVDCSGYVRHIRFLVEKSKIYVPSALMGYDSEMRERAEIFGPSVFSYGYYDLTHRWLGVESLKSVSVQSVSSASKNETSKSSRFGVCWAWNENKPCKANPCKYKHVCSKCQEDHKQVNCTSKVTTTQSSKSAQ